jgi:hypothetical protein
MPSLDLWLLGLVPWRLRIALSPVYCVVERGRSVATPTLATLAMMMLFLRQSIAAIPYVACAAVAVEDACTKGGN